MGGGGHQQQVQELKKDGGSHRDEEKWLRLQTSFLKRGAGSRAFRGDYLAPWECTPQEQEVRVHGVSRGGIGEPWGPATGSHPRERCLCTLVLIQALPGSATYSGFYFPDYHFFL